MKITAYCYQSGEIQFTSIEAPEVPQGCIPIITGPQKRVKQVVGACARHAHDGVTLLVPGLPEIELTQKDPVDVLLEWQRWVQKRFTKPNAPLTLA